MENLGGREVIDYKFFHQPAVGGLGPLDGGLQPVGDPVELVPEDVSDLVRSGVVEPEAWIRRWLNRKLSVVAYDLNEDGAPVVIRERAAA